MARMDTSCLATGWGFQAEPTHTYTFGLSHDDGDIVHGQTHGRKFVIPVGEPLHGNTWSGHEQLEPRDVDGTSFASRMAMVKRVLGDSLPQAPVKAKLTPTQPWGDLGPPGCSLNHQWVGIAVRWTPSYQGCR